MPAGASPSSNKHQRGDVHTQEHIVRMVRPVAPHYSKRYSFLRCNGRYSRLALPRCNVDATAATAPLQPLQHYSSYKVQHATPPLGYLAFLGLVAVNWV